MHFRHASMHYISTLADVRLHRRRHLSGEDYAAAGTRRAISSSLSGRKQAATLPPSLGSGGGSCTSQVPSTYCGQRVWKRQPLGRFRSQRRAEREHESLTGKRRLVMLRHDSQCKHEHARCSRPPARRLDATSRSSGLHA
jgi:hypothetical protein